MIIAAVGHLLAATRTVLTLAVRLSTTLALTLALVLTLGLTLALLSLTSLTLVALLSSTLRALRLLTLGLLILRTLILSLLILLALSPWTIVFQLPLLSALFGALTHAFVHRFQSTNEITRAIGGLCLLSLTIRALGNALCLLNLLAKVRDVGTDLLLGGVEPIRRHIAYLLLRVPDLFFDLAASERIGRRFERT